MSSVLPEYHFSERHSIRVAAPPERIWAVVRHGELLAHPVVRLLMGLRGMRRKTPRTFSLELCVEEGFSIVKEEPPREIVLALEGPFWRPDCKLRPVDADTFRTPIPHGVARAAWDFTIADDGTVTTETRVLCAADSRRKFAVYWFFIRPFSGLIRRMILRSIRKAAERR